MDANKSICPETLSEAKTIIESESTSIRLYSRIGPLVARVPVVISKTKVHINIMSSFNFSHAYDNIRSFKHEVCISQCSLVDLGDRHHGKIYLSGFIREHIEYAAISCVHGSTYSGDMLFQAFKVPFECSAKIDYCTLPIIKESNQFIAVGLSPVVKSPQEACLSSFVKDSNIFDQRLGYGPERIFCELEDINILETEITPDSAYSEKQLVSIQEVNAVTEYILLSITFTLLQWQTVSIPRHSSFSDSYRV